MGSRINTFRCFATLALLPSFACAEEGISRWLNAESNHLGYNDALFGTSAEQANRAADREKTRGDEALASADRKAGLGDQIGKDHKGLERQLSELDRKPFSSPAERAQARTELLNRAYQPPKAFRDATAALGLRNYNDLHQKGPEVQKRLEAEMNKDVEAFQRFQDQAKKGSAAGTQLTKLQEKLNDVRQRMASLPTAKVAGTNTAKSENVSGSGGAERADSVPASVTNRLNPPLGRAADVAAVKNGSNETGKTGSALALGLISPEGKAKPSLREKLRAALAAAQARGDSTAVASLEKEIAKAESETLEKLEGASRALASITEDSKANPAAFIMGAAASDVSGIVNAFEHSLSEDSISLFQRVKRRHDACVIGRRL